MCGGEKTEAEWPPAHVSHDLTRMCCLVEGKNTASTVRRRGAPIHPSLHQNKPKTKGQKTNVSNGSGNHKKDDCFFGIPLEYRPQMGLSPFILKLKEEWRSLCLLLNVCCRLCVTWPTDPLRGAGAPYGEALSEAALLRFGELSLFQWRRGDLIRFLASCRSCTLG